MRALLPKALIGLLVLATASASWAEGVDARDTFERLKSLAGTWHGQPEAQGPEAEAEADHTGEVTHEFRVSAAGTVVMETMNPGSDHEMINMYHLDGDDLVLTHYCSSGNQPRMRLDRARSTAEMLIFEFVGGTHLDPSADHHIHSAEITWVEGDRLQSRWFAHNGDEKSGTMTFHLSRSQ